MRLSRPLFTQHGLQNLELWDFASVAVPKDGAEKCHIEENSLQNLDGAFSSKFGLLLPQSFGYQIFWIIFWAAFLSWVFCRTIYLGETFQSYLRVQNVGSSLVSNVTIKVQSVMNIFFVYWLLIDSVNKADLQTAAQRLPLTKKNKVSLAQLEPQQSIDDILSHEITEIGTHM